MLNNLATIMQNFIRRFWKLTELFVVKFLLCVQQRVVPLNLKIVWPSI